jgi:hypothetical protein
MATATVVERLTAPTGMNASLAALSMPDCALAKPVRPEQVGAQNAATDLAERSSPLKYPTINVYWEKMINDQREKFRRFSGNVVMTIEVRHSQDRLNGLQDALELYIDSIAQTLDAQRGDWGNGMFYGGGYEVALNAVKHGGRNFVQAAKVTFRIEVSRS